MSAGRKRASLVDLQGVADDGYLTSVRKFLLGEGAPAGPSTADPVVLSPEDYLQAADLDWEAYGKPADWAHRTTRADVRRMVAEAAKKRLALADFPLVDMALFGRQFPKQVRFSKEDRDRVARVVRECYLVELAGLPSAPARKPDVAKMPTRETHDGECSRVVRRFRDGRVMVGGKVVSEDEAFDALRTIGVQ